MRSSVTRVLAVVPVMLAVSLALAGGCSRKKEPVVRLAEGGQEAWVVDDVPYMIRSTHYERGAGNTVVYIIQYPAPRGTDAKTVDMEGAGILVWPLVKYAYNNKTFERAKIPPEKGSTPSVVRMAVDLLSPDGKKVLLRYDVPPAK
jgi:hypothetical protein